MSIHPKRTFNSTMDIVVMAGDSPDKELSIRWAVNDFFKDCPVGQIVDGWNNGRILVEPEDVKTMLEWSLKNIRCEKIDGKYVAIRE